MVYTYSSNTGAIVFIIGGESYTKYQNVTVFAQHSTQCKSIMYESTDIFNADYFLYQLARLN
ncbi:hypothetical protein LPJ53_004820 [Coemansia erecta]|uniref:Uncharacterized protein n=1 Tax=Coemansia erecta TaxID=147472 RepID=A0A9W8CPE8_9FUNG|nr:hypothetical protein LPJ53_004820 [Coemansia erecta]